MFGHQFYPTPPHLAGLIKGIVTERFKGREALCILDPSAGRGDLLDQFKVRGYGMRLLACEIDPDLRSVLEGKGHVIVHHDFLTFPGMAGVDAIVMNPPFDKGAEHVLHAWRVLPPGGLLVAVLNAETLRKTSVSPVRRALAEVVNANGKAEDIGTPFRDAARKTSVECVLITIEKPDAATGFWDSFRPEMRREEGQEGAPLAQGELAFADPVEAKVASFEAALRIIEQSVKGLRRAASYLEGVFDAENGGVRYDKPERIFDDILRSLSGDLSMVGKGKNCPANMGTCTEWATIKAWNTVVQANDSVMSMIPSSLKNELSAKLGGYQRMAYTASNIRQMMEMFYTAGPEVGKEIILNAFKLMTFYNAKNRMAEKAWKTNDAYKVREKFIMSGWIRPGYNAVYANYHSEHEMNDIDRAMCLLTGKRMERKYDPVKREYVSGILTIREALDMQAPQGEAVESEFFRLVKYAGVGSVHVTFKYKGLWQDFNQAVARYNKWLPDETNGNNTGRHWKR